MLSSGERLSTFKISCKCCSVHNELQAHQPASALPDNGGEFSCGFLSGVSIYIYRCKHYDHRLCLPVDSCGSTLVKQLNIALVQAAIIDGINTIPVATLSTERKMTGCNASFQCCVCFQYCNSLVPTWEGHNA